MVQEVYIRIYQLDEDGKISEDYEFKPGRKVKYDKTIPPLGLGIIAKLELTSVYSLITQIKVKMFNIKRRFHFEVYYNEKTYEFFATKPTAKEKSNADNKYFLFTLKKTEFIIKPKIKQVEQFKEKPLENKANTNYFDLISGIKSGQFDKSFSPIIFTGMKD